MVRPAPVGTYFTLKLSPSVGSGTKAYVGVTLHVTFTPQYPDHLPEVRMCVFVCVCGRVYM